MDVHTQTGTHIHTSTIHTLPILCGTVGSVCQHNKARAVASPLLDKVGDIKCLAPDPSGGDRPSGEEKENRNKEMEK